MLYDEDSNLYEFKIINKIIKELSVEEKYSYSVSNGGNEFKNSILKLVFLDYLENVKRNFFVEVSATPGGSGALYATFKNFLSKDEYILLPEYAWDNYDSICLECELKNKKYPLFNDSNNFNIDKLNDLLDEQLKTQNGYILINDPCHNPTGYTLKEEEWIKLISILNNKNKEKEITLILDIAYMEYYDIDSLKYRRLFNLLTNLNSNIKVVICFSGSKCFSLYGLRIGAIIYLTKIKNDINHFNDVINFTLRSTWSTSSTLGINIINKLVNNNDYYLEYKKELNNSILTLKNRAKLFLEEANKYKILYYPFQNGFFITIKCDGYKTFNKLKEKDVFVVPLDYGIRITLSSINLKEIKPLVEKIKESLEE